MQVEKQEKEIITSNITNILKFISSTNEDTQNYLFFNETLFLNHNSWLENIKNQIRKSIKGQNDSINFSNINYNKDIYNLLKKIAKPNNYRSNENTNNDNINQEDMEKLDKLTDFNDILGANNICSKYKRESLLSRIHNNDNNNNIINNDNNNNNENININSDENNRITFNENNNNNKVVDEDIIMEDIITSTQKVKLSSGQIEKEENSLCTIVEQPSLEEMKKSIFSNKFTSNQLEEKNKTGINGKYILDFNNNSSNFSNNAININKSANNNYNYKPLKLSESIITPKKEENNNNINNINNNINNTPNDKTKEINLNQQFSFNKIGQNTNNNNIHINSKNEITFNFSSNKKYLSNLSSNKTPQEKEKEKININNNENDITDTPTLNPNFQSSNNKNINNTNNPNKNNFINVITNTINKINEDKNTNIHNNINNNNNSINNNLPKKNYIQEIVLLSSTKKVPEINNVKNKIKKEKYLDDFEEYEMSDSSQRGDEVEEEDEEDEINNKFKPKWALDEEYISSQLQKQNNNKDLIFKSFGNFVVEHLNLNMIFETHNQNFDIRNSTADWRGDDSWTKNKVTDVIDGNDIFPNRKLQFV